MKALVYEGAWQMPVKDVPIPEINEDEVLIAVESVGICGSDVHGYRGTTGRRKPPIIMGHEFSGKIAKVGAKIDRYKEGDRVIAQPLQTCGYCDNCKAGFPNICSNRNILGVNINGAYADYVKVTENMLYHLPDEMDFNQGSLVEPLAVAMRAVNLTDFQLSETVAILGVGTIGLLTILAARMKGAGKIIVSDMNEHRLLMAKKLGADIIVNGKEKNLVEVVRSETDGKGVAAVIEAVGITATANQSLFVVRNGGSVTWIGNSDPEVTINMQQIVTRELTLKGTYGFNKEFEYAIDAIKSGRVDPTLLVEANASLTDGPKIIDDLASGKSDLIKVILKP